MNNLNGYKIHTMKWDDEQGAFYCSFRTTYPQPTHHIETYITINSLHTLWQEDGDTDERRDIILEAIFTIPDDAWKKGMEDVKYHTDLQRSVLPSVKAWSEVIREWYLWMDTQRAFNRD